jgi:predicted TIM-barrel enzyme
VIDGNFRRTLEETGMSFALEIEMIRLAHEMDLLTTPYVFDVEQARAMTEAGADIVIPHMNTTTKGSIGVSASTAPTLEQAAQRVQAMADAAKEINPEVLVLCHGGPIADPQDAQYILDHTRGVVGFYGASSIERLPVEPAITNRVREFTNMRVAKP